MKNKLSFIASLIVHAAVALTAYYYTPELNKKKEKIEVTLEDKGPKGANLPRNVIQMGIGDKKNDKPKDYYWGIGISYDWRTEANEPMRVGYIYQGYSADLAGLESGDIILAVDGRPPNNGDNDIKGNGPKMLVLTIKRGDRIFDVNVPRVKVYY